MAGNWQDWWQAGLAAHGEGDLARAAGLYDQVLISQPGFASAWLARGVIRLLTGELASAEADLRRAVDLDPQALDARNNLGVALIRQSRLEEALAVLDQTLALSPDMAEAHNNRGDALRRLGRLEEACGAFAKAAQLRSGFASALQNLAETLADLGRTADAIPALSQLAALASGQSQPLIRLGEALLSAGRPTEALSVFQAVGDPARAAEARFYIGVALFQLGRKAEAEAAFRGAIAADPALVQAHHNLGKALMALDRPEEALAAYGAALALSPGDLEAQTGLGQGLRALGRLEEAEASFARVWRARPSSGGAANNLASTLYEQGRFEQALRLFDQAIALDPALVDAHHNRAFNALMLGELASGFASYEWRKRLASPNGFRPYAEPEWTGREDVAGKTLFVHWEQGYGDTIQFCRYLPLLCDRGAKVVFASQDGLEPLIRTVDPRIEVIGQQARPERFDLHVPLMSLPLAFGTTLDSVPARIPYLHPEPARVEAWRDRVGAGGFRIGVSWRTSRLGAQLGKSVPLSGLAGVAAIAGVRLISLQKGEGSEEINTLPPGMRVEALGRDFDTAGLFLDSAAVMQSLDLVITVDTALAHLAGALGRPAFVALKHVADWRWLARGSASPWYPSLTLFRQDRPGDWAPVMAQVQAGVEALAGLRP